MILLKIAEVEQVQTPGLSMLDGQQAFLVGCPPCFQLQRTHATTEIFQTQLDFDLRPASLPSKQEIQGGRQPKLRTVGNVNPVEVSKSLAGQRGYENLLV